MAEHYRANHVKLIKMNGKLQGEFNEPHIEIEISTVTPLQDIKYRQFVLYFFQQSAKLHH